MISSRRAAIVITYAVWKALFLREAVFRLSGSRLSWLWLLMEPLAQVIVMLFIYGVFRQSVINSMDGGLFIMVGMLGYTTYDRTSSQCMNAVSANAALFTYRQVKPVDTVIVRAILEGFLTLMVSIILILGMDFLGYPVAMDDPLLVIYTAFALWFLGFGMGLSTSVLSVLQPDLIKIYGFLTRPLFFISAIFFPAYGIPQPYREWLLLNPIAHGLELLRHGFNQKYHIVPETSLYFLLACGLVMTLLGQALHVRYAEDLTTQ